MEGRGFGTEVEGFLKVEQHKPPACRGTNRRFVLLGYFDGFDFDDVVFQSAGDFGFQIVLFG
jgi:hypothetical protein